MSTRTTDKSIHETPAARRDIQVANFDAPDRRASVGCHEDDEVPGPEDSSTQAAGLSSAQRIAARGGRVTRTRMAVLDTLRSAVQSLAHDEVGAALAAAGIAHDRVTLYRTLDWLVTNGLAHRVAGSDRIWRFNAAVEEGHSHAHFQCARCGAIFCLETTSPTLAATLPKGFQFERAELTVYGICPKC